MTIHRIEPKSITPRDHAIERFGHFDENYYSRILHIWNTKLNNLVEILSIDGITDTADAEFNSWVQVDILYGLF